MVLFHLAVPSRTLRLVGPSRTDRGMPDRWGMPSLRGCPGASTEARLLLEPVVVGVHHHGRSPLGEDKIPLIYQRERRAGGTGDIVTARCNPNQRSRGSAICRYGVTGGRIKCEDTGARLRRASLRSAA